MLQQAIALPKHLKILLNNSEMVEELDDEKRDNNQNERKICMTSEQEKDFLDQFEKIVLGTWRPKED